MIYWIETHEKRNLFLLAWAVIQVQVLNNIKIWKLMLTSQDIFFAYEC